MRRVSRLMIGLGVLIVLLAGVWAMVAPRSDAKLPGDLDKTAAATGTFTMYADTSKQSLLKTPTSAPLDLQQRLRVVESTSEHAVVDENQIESVPGMAPQTFRQQYVLDRENSRNLEGAQSWAYTPSTKVNRSPYWSVSLPSDIGSGTYLVWNNEIGAAVPFVGAGTVKVDGVTLQRLAGKVSHAPVQGYFLKQFSTPLPATMSPDQVDKLFNAVVFDRALTSRWVIPLMTSADAAALRKLQDTDVPLHYQLDAATTLLVDPQTGLVSDIAKVDETLYAVPDLVAIRQLKAIFSRPGYAASEVMQDGVKVLDGILANTPRLKILRVSYQQTPASVADFVSYAKSKGDKSDFATRTLPLILLVVGIVVIAVGLVLAATAGRKGEGPGPGESIDVPDQPGFGRASPAVRGSHRKPARHAAK